MNKFNCIKQCYVVVTRYETCLKRNAERERKVPENVINRMLKSFWVPQYFEGWDKIIFVKGENYQGNNLLQRLIDMSFGFNQESKHHSMTLLEHQNEVFNYLVKQNRPLDVCLAGQFHDMGKLYTKSFINSKGELDTTAHYYNHNTVGAYLFMTARVLKYTKEVDKTVYDNRTLSICNLIQHHMQFYGNKNTDKLQKLLGNDTWQKLLWLNEADRLCR